MNERARRLLRRVLRVGFVVAVVGGLALAVTDEWAQVGRSLARLHPLPVAAAVVVFVVGLITSMLAWRVVLADLGSPLPVVTAARIFFVGQLGKYLPGSVWPVVAQMEMGRDADVPRPRMATTYVVALGVSVVTGGLVGVLCLPALLHGSASRYALALLVIPLGAVVLHPRVINPLVSLGLRVLKRPPLEHPLSGASLLRAAGLSVLTWIAFGVQMALLAHATGGGSWARILPLSTGAYALGMTAGVLVIPLPAGAGVREAVIVAVLAEVIPTPAATAAAIVSRLVVTFADAVVAGVAALSARGVLRANPVNLEQKAAAARERAERAGGSRAGGPTPRQQGGAAARSLP